MELVATLLCIGAVLAVLAAGAWTTRPAPDRPDPEVVVRLREAVVDPGPEAALRARIPPDARVLQLGGIGLGHLAAAWGATALGDVTWAHREHPEGDFRAADPAHARLFLPESFTHVVIRDLDEVQHKAVWLQNAHRWLEPEGVLLLDSPRRASKGGVTWEARDADGRRTEVLTYRGKTWRHSRPIYQESAATLLDMVETAGFLPRDGGFVKAAV
jgi:hypothetical protein